MRFVTLFVLAGSLLGPVSQAEAAPVLWTLNNVVFDDGGTAIGSFIFEDVTGAYTGVNVTTTAGIGFGGDTYAAPNPIFHPNPGFNIFLNMFPLVLANFTGTPVFNLWFSSGLTSAGGFVPLTLSATREMRCLDAGCIGISVYRTAQSGGVSGVPAGTPVPEPATLLLLGSGLAASAVRRYRGRR